VGTRVVVRKVKKNTNIVFSYPLLIGMFLCVLIPLCLLVVEYKQMSRAADRLLELKEDYRSYSMTLKRLIKEKSRESVPDAQDVKKKTITNAFALDGAIVFSSDIDREDFSVVNRDPDYLRDSAITFAKQHQLDQVLAKMFDSESWDELPVVKGFPVKKKRKKTGPTISGVPAWARLKSEPQRQAHKDFLCSWPVDKGKFWFSSPFGPRKIGKNKWKFHYGVDLAAHRGTPIKAVAAGIVIQSEFHKGYGNCITIVHNRKYKTRYAHLNMRKVVVGQKIKRGGVIGTVGATGFVKKSGKDASHLHFEVYAFGRHINPVSVLV
jgi:murein DD-endopeptidase MepM/ murein hydrolase activator NlpD